MPKTLGAISAQYKLGMVVHTRNPNTQEVETSDQKFKAILDYILDLRST